MSEGALPPDLAVGTDAAGVAGTEAPRADPAHASLPVPIARGRLARAFRSKLTWLLVFPLVLLVAAGSTLSFVNYERADDWEQQAVVLDHQNSELRTLLGERSRELNERVRQLNTMAAKVTAAERALRRSEADVTSLEQRQRELAAEKANVEDQRQSLLVQQDALHAVAGGFVECKGGLIEIVGYLAREQWDSASYYWDEVSYDCDSAENSLQSYIADYGG